MHKSNPSSSLFVVPPFPSIPSEQLHEKALNKIEAVGNGRHAPQIAAFVLKKVHGIRFQFLAERVLVGESLRNEVGIWAIKSWWRFASEAST